MPRFSVDLDFDLLYGDDKTEAMILDKITNILKKHGRLKDQRIKRYTIFSLLSYGDADHNIKIEINKRYANTDIKKCYALKKYLGIPMLVATKEYLFAGKLIALLSRNELAMRDIYDIYFFAKNNWDIDIAILEERTEKKLKAYLGDCIKRIEKVKSNRILHGLGDLLSPQDKIWVKNHLIEEVIFMLKNYQASVR